MILISLVFILGCFIFLRLIKGSNSSSEIGIFVFSIVLFVAIVSFPLNYYDTGVSIAKFNATKQTVASFRKNGDNFEKVALQIKVIESNQWLAKVQFLRGGLLKMWIPKQVDWMEPIE
jgi:hypothetical protein